MSFFGKLANLGRSIATGYKYGLYEAFYVIALKLALLIKSRFIVESLYSRHRRNVLSFLESSCRSVIDRYQSFTPNTDAPKEVDRIVTMWLQGEQAAPEVVRSCISRARKMFPDKQIVVVDDDVLRDLPIDPILVRRYQEGAISRTHMSDIVRMFYMKEYGCLWMDSTMFVQSAPDSLLSSEFYTISHPLRWSQLGELCVPSLMPDADSYKAQWTGFFMLSKSHGIVPSFVYDVFVEYWKHNDALMDYFLIDYVVRLGYEKVPQFRQAIDSIPTNNDGSVHKLVPILNEPYSESTWKSLCQSPLSVFKLTYKDFTPSSDPNSFYQKVIRKSI